MDGQKPEVIEEQSRTENPEDVAVLYSWANLQGARYRDFSGARRESRALMRQRAAQEAKDAESRAQAEAEAAAAASERAAREAEEIARLHEKAARKAAEAKQRRDLELEEIARAQAMRQATELSRKAAEERVQAAKRAEAAAAAEAAERREAREITEARASAERQALRYAEAEMRRRKLAGPQPVAKLPGELTDPYQHQRQPDQPPPEKVFATLVTPEQDMRPARFPARDGRFRLPPMGIADEADTMGFVADPITAAFAVTEPEPLPETQSSNRNGHAAISGGPPKELQDSNGTKQASAQAVPSAPTAGEHAQAQAALPAWLQEEEHPKRHAEAAVDATLGDTLQQSRERVASRWFALRELFDQGPQEQAPAERKSATGEVPVLAVFSLAGGVGKTSLVATLGRALASSGEKVLLTDTTSHGLLPFYFGASELKPGVVRTFAPPVGSADAPIHLLSFDLLEKGGDLEAQDWLAEELTRNSQGMQRVLVDLSPSVPWVLRRLARMNSIVMVPMKPDMSSVISLNVVEKFFADVTDGNGKPLHPRYVLNGFDASQPLHLDVREVLRQQLGDRLLPFVIRRSPAVSEALAEGMTVMDYAPDTAVAGDVLNLASWLRTQAAPASGFRKARWSEQ
ncbi:MAG TPA: cellulose synthase operon protein YhjQ/BcsQ [Acidobacteriaceae bacterium]|nr:cellulose synthase operon protein YhjQ/BcsQ [Acidobacteriaceae bacterium]